MSVVRAWAYVSRFFPCEVDMISNYVYIGGNSKLIEFKSDIFAEDVAVWYSTSLQDGAQESILVKLLIDSIHLIPFPLQTLIFP